MSDFTTPSLALMLLLTGFAYSLPVLLFPSNHSLNGSMSSEVLNLYFLVGWMGLAHFIYAYYGQALALKRNPANLAPYLIGVVLGAIVLATMRYFMGFMLFSFLMWIYFLPHFVKAEIHFTTVLEKKTVKESAGVYLFPAIAFSFFTFALFGPVEFVSNPWNLILMAVGCLVLGLFLGLKKQLSDRGVSRYALLAIFLIAEALVWATYRKYMVFQFQEGIYVFHIAMASFYHYMRSYDFARRMGISRGEPVTWKYSASIVCVNLVVVLLGYIVLRTSALAPFDYLFDVSYFTFWVGLHQWASDVFNHLKKRPQPVAVQA